VAARRFDEDHLGAEIGEQLAGERCGLRGDLHHPDAGERAVCAIGHQITPSARS
jgi:hypothetical protein